MIVVVETIQAVQGKKEELKKALLTLVPISRKEMGCLQYDLLEPTEEKEKFLVLMRWKNLKDLRNHETSATMAEFEKKYDQVLYDEVEVTEWKEIL